MTIAVRIETHAKQSRDTWLYRRSRKSGSVAMPVQM
jgi:hypothetical protein